MSSKIQAIVLGHFALHLSPSRGAILFLAVTHDFLIFVKCQMLFGVSALHYRGDARATLTTHISN